MDVMILRRGLMMGMANNIARGTFAGTNTTNITLDIGFEPDYVIIERASKTLRLGIQNVTFIRGRAAYNSICYTLSGTLKAQCYGTYIFENDDIWGANNSDPYHSYASYSDGRLTVSNVTNAVRCFFIDNDSYSWMAIKN